MRAALLSVASDLPAIRKITQFLGHKADLGCTRCKFRAEREAGTVGASVTIHPKLVSPGSTSKFVCKEMNTGVQLQNQLLQR